MQVADIMVELDAMPWGVRMDRDPPPKLRIAETFEPSAVEALICALDEAAIHGFPYLGSSHLVLGAATISPAFRRAFEAVTPLEGFARVSMSIDSTLVHPDEATFQRAIEARSEPLALRWHRVHSAYLLTGALPMLQYSAEVGLSTALRLATGEGRTRIDAEDLGWCGVDGGTIIVRAFEELGIDAPTVRAAAARYREWGAFTKLLREAE